jgi:2-polyprenyl-3-methyl-5-hydroxy-6-metoxy-1,4-benzoquinol methylase
MNRSRYRGTNATGQAFKLAREVLGSKVERELLNVYDLSPDKLGTFDVVFISDVLVHLRDPLKTMENICSVTRGQALIASAFDPELDRSGRALIDFAGTEALWVWWTYSSTVLKKLMMVAGFDRVEEVSRIPAQNRAGNFWKLVLRGHAPA